MFSSMFNFSMTTTLFSKSFRSCLSSLTFVPKCNPARAEELEQLKEYLKFSARMCVLTGAGISTESGIPDYRSEGVGLFATSDRRPVSYKDFCGSDKVRTRYWARNYIGWPRFSSFEPNVTHKLLKKLEDIGRVSCIVTQNVESLHVKAGSQNIIELHGTAFRVMCLNCDQKISRYSFQEILDELNPSITSFDETIRPDGDVELSQEQVEEFKVPSCSNCGGVLKPDIVFFGENVARAVVELIKQEVETADFLLILGTSLTTFSGYRIVLQALEAKKPIAIVNIGKTRGDEYANIKVQGRCGEILHKMYAEELQDVS
ncbi:NAD-dependent protein deacylase Sirt4-like [Belonocnema kinseyi]|uniref:NAD-dependent protein deacylase Sirt4-like n=1 Tax=Belonocnema kinseyi TaxID=2817044 RepID=UPI00143DF378|nr:NAD-dependent protein deacylase Sirt4-like [Belonocnema kinseyi]